MFQGEITMKTAGEIIIEKGTHMVHVSPNDTLKKALEKMVSKNIGAIVVMANEEVVGIWTERHLLKSILDPNFNIEKAIINEYMAKDIETIDHNEPIYLLSDKMLGLYTRYLFITKKDKIIGMLSSGDIIRACLIERKNQLESIGWEYYESWKHK